jgi:hypothetical protein
MLFASISCSDEVNLLQTLRYCHPIARPDKRLLCRYEPQRQLCFHDAKGCGTRVHYTVHTQTS